MFKAKFGVRGRVLAIALVPSLALLSAGAGASVYLFEQGSHAQNWSTDIRAATSPGIDWLEAMQQERRLTMLQVTGARPNPKDLAAQRSRVDNGVVAMQNASQSVQKLNASAMQGTGSAFAQLSAQLNAIRQSADAGLLPPQNAYDFYSGLINLALTAMDVVARTAPDAHTAVEANRSDGIFNSIEAMLRSSALATVAATKNGMTLAQLAEFDHQAGYYHAELTNLAQALTAGPQAQLQKIMASDAWQRISNLEDAILRRGTTPADQSDEIVDPRARQDDVNEIGDGLTALWNAQNDLTLKVASDAGDRTSRNSLVGGAATISLAVLAFLIALWLSNRLVGRLRRLRGETLALADERLPHIMNLLVHGANVDLENEVTRLNYGKDEIGEVADAFNRAQGAAIAAAVTEAKTREGVKAVFLNIAHRAQVVVHKQLELLDQAEYETEDSEELDMLFQLDHLATRERRNAENLIILGGEQPGRRWRSPVPLVELVRSAVAETEDYARVRIGRMPEVLIAGTVVADLIHLLAELVDNATSFSPPGSRVEVAGNVVGRGVVVEITDQGLGMAAEEIARINENLRNPPDFSVSTLSSDSRLGLFVVAQLATRNGTSVRLVESDYGGIKAIVLVPTSLIAAESSLTDPGLGAEHTQQLRRRVRLPNPDRPTMTGENPMVPRPVEVPLDAPADSGLVPVAPATAGNKTGDGRPALPRRSRQAHLAPQLVLATPVPSSSDSAEERPRSAEQARDLLSAIEIGTRQGRHVQPEPVPNATIPDEREDQW